MNPGFCIEDFEPIATGRSESIFAADMARHAGAMREALSGTRIAVIGAAGSIGFSVVRTLLRFSPRAMTLIDLSENNLVEVVRNLRSASDPEVPEDFEALPIDLGGPECRRYFQDVEPFDYIFNLSALKHVRSEKNIYSLGRMIFINILAPIDLIESLPRMPRKYFSVSSDKAANPAGLMGASKRIMEMALRGMACSCSSARFANVAFSDGSLPWGFLRRIEKRQPLSAPRDVRRFFMSHQEAGEICVLSAALGDDGDVFIPRLEPWKDEKRFDRIAVELLARLDYEAVDCATDEEARACVGELTARGKWPCWFTPVETAGEKPYEEFHTADESPDFEGFERIGIVRPLAGEDELERLREFLDFARSARTSATVTREDYIRAMSRAVPGLRHQGSARQLDDRM